MPEPTPQEEMTSRINSLSSKLRNLQSETQLSGVRDAVEDLDTQIAGLKNTVNDLRGKGYVFGKGFEDQAATLETQWRKVRPGVMLEIQNQPPRLSQGLRPLEAQMAQIQARATNPSAVKYAVDKLENELEAFDGKVSAANSAVRGMFDSISSEAQSFKSTLEKIGKMLQQFAAASFRLLPSEGMLMAVKAAYSTDEKMEKADPDGILFLTDQRLLFEQNEEVATKKVLFITTEKQKVQKLLLEVPLVQIETTQASKKGLFKNEDHLALTFKSGAPVYQAWFHLDGQDSNEWQAMIGRACSGDCEGDRAVAVDPEQVKKQKSAPSQCPNCGAPMNQVVLRGMDSITCAYCQHVVRL